MPGDPLSGYYNDLTPELQSLSPESELGRLQLLTTAADVNPTTIAQLGLAAWQRRDEGDGWRAVTAAAATYLVDRMDADGGISFTVPMRHTYVLSAPWLSAMTQGETASLLIRTASFDDRLDFATLAVRAADPLFSPPLVATTPEGPVLQEYPTSPPAHVLNGWIFALWGLFDVANGDVEPEARERCREAFEAGAAALASRLHMYDTWGWSRYDLYPHPTVHVASPYYHRLHVELLRALADLVPDDRFRFFADRWERSLGQPFSRALSVARKATFRLIRPRRVRLTRTP